MAPERVLVRPPQDGFQGFFQPERVEQPRGRHERIIMISDLHGAKQDVMARIRAIPTEGDHKPAVVVLGGDVVGNPALEDLQRKFYNGVINPARAAIGAQADIAPADLLNFRGSVDGPTLEEGFRELRRTEMELEGLVSDNLTGEKKTRKETLEAQLVDKEYISREIKRYATEYVHYGHYVANLEPDAVNHLVAGTRDGAETLAAELLRLQKGGVDVVINEGNWDPSPPFAFKRGTKDAVRLSPEEQFDLYGFSTQRFFEDKGIEYHTQMHVVETDTSALVLLPFDELVRFADQDQDQIGTYAHDQLAHIAKVREADKQIIVVQHGEVLWEPHNLKYPNSEPKGEHKKVIDGGRKINALIKPDEVLHGHFHDPFADEKGQELPLDTKYAVQFTLFDAAPIVIDPDKHAVGQTVVSYVQLQRFANILVPRDIPARAIAGFGGSRQPALVE